MNSIVKVRIDLFFQHPPPHLLNNYYRRVNCSVSHIEIIYKQKPSPDFIVSDPDVSCPSVSCYAISCCRRDSMSSSARSALDDIIIQTKSCNKIGAHTHTHTHTHKSREREGNGKREREREITSHVSIYLLINKPCLIHQLFYIEIMIKIQEV